MGLRSGACGVLYRTAVPVAYTLAYPWLTRRYRIGLADRRGFYDEEVRRLGEEHPLWVHAVSVGEVQAAAPLVAAARAGVAPPLLLSTTTPTGKRMAETLAAGTMDRHIYYPWDVPRIVDRALAALQPRCYVAMETEIWPHLLQRLQRAGIPAFMANGRMSDAGFARYRRFRPFVARLLESFTLLMVRSPLDRERFLQLGAPPERVHVTGDCKVEAILNRREAARSSPEILGVRGTAGPGPLFVAGSTHPGEEAVVLDAFASLKAKRSDARLVLAPRHPERAEGLLEQARSCGTAQLLSRMTPGWEILVADRVGVLFGLYSLACGAFIGGSLVPPRQGQNILEPAVWGVPAVHGPNMANFAEHTRRLDELGAAWTVSDSADLAVAMETFAAGEPSTVAGMRAMEYVSAIGGAATAAWRMIAECLERERPRL